MVNQRRCYTTDSSKRWEFCDPLPNPLPAAATASGGKYRKTCHEMITDNDFYGSDGFKSTKMEWSGEVCEGGKIKWNSMKSLAGTTRPDQAAGCSES